jgi:hypothetical protein
LKLLAFALAFTSFSTNASGAWYTKFECLQIHWHDEAEAKKENDETMAASRRAFDEVMDNNSSSERAIDLAVKRHDEQMEAASKELKRALDSTLAAYKFCLDMSH